MLLQCLVICGLVFVGQGLPFSESCTLPENRFTSWKSREGFKCGDHSPYRRCIPAAWRCDGDRDCYDGSDELNCEVETTTNTVETTHRTSGEVTPGSEPNLPGRDSSADEETTPAPEDADKRCMMPPIFRTLLGTDEGYRCGDGRCIPASFVCDGDQDCMDGSDELNCPGAEETVTQTITTSTSSPDSNNRGCLFLNTLFLTDGFVCRSTGTCLPGSIRCDGKQDCFDWSDEQNCTSETMTTTGLVSKTNRLEGDSSVHKEIAPTFNERRCTGPPIFLTLFGTDAGHRCSKGGICIPVSFVCDGDRDCMDGSDELNCPGPVETVSQTITTSTSSSNDVITNVDSNGRCTMPPTWRRFHGTNEGHRCGDGRCIPVSYRCDGDRDCADGSDELNCPGPVETVIETITSSTSSPDKATTPGSNVFPFPSTDQNLMTNENMNINSTANTNNPAGEIIQNQVREKKKRFELESTRASWMEAHAICKSKGGELASITTEDENSQAELALTISGEDGECEAWIAGYCPYSFDSLACYWTDSWKQFNRSWFAGKPNHLYVAQVTYDDRCLQLTRQGRSECGDFDNRCYTELPFLCQYLGEKLADKVQ